MIIMLAIWTLEQRIKSDWQIRVEVKRYGDERIKELLLAIQM